MAPREHFLARLLSLPRIKQQSERRAVFRQAVVALGLEGSGAAPLALAGCDPEALRHSVRVAQADGLLDALDFVAPSAAAVALCQLAEALPLSDERRAVGRKVLSHLYNGDAEAFAALGARLALGSSRALGGAGIRARVSLALALPPAAAPSVDPLAWAITTRRELAEQWVEQGSTGSLPERRLAARLLERAARQAGRLAAEGDEHPLRLFRGVCQAGRVTSPPPGGESEPAPVARAWHRLLGDRETLVWRHVAVARGLLCRALPPLVAEIRANLDPGLGVTEWRRAACSATARIAVACADGLAEAMAILDGPLVGLDPGIPMAMLWGLGPVVEMEPEAAEELVDALARLAPVTIADSLAELRFERPGFGDQSARACARALRASLRQPDPDDGLRALGRAIAEELEGAAERPLQAAVAAALAAYATGGPQPAFAKAGEALARADTYVAALERLAIHYGEETQASAERQQAMVLLREIDTTLLESDVLASLLLLDRRPGSEGTAVGAIDEVGGRIFGWLLDPARRQATDVEIKTQRTLQQRQLRALLHVVDSASTDFGDDQPRRLRVRSRWAQVCHELVAHVRQRPGTPLDRATIATVARSLDALVRDGAAEIVDVLLYVATLLPNPQHLQICAEASMQPDASGLLRRYAELARGAAAGADTTQNRLHALRALLGAFPSQTTLRAETVRTTAERLVRALEGVLATGSLEALVPEDDAAAEVGPLGVVEAALAQLQQLVAGAERRCSERVSEERAAALDLQHGLCSAVEHAVSTGSIAEVLAALGAAARAAHRALPPAFAVLVAESLSRLAALPAMPAEPLDLVQPVRSQRNPLPGWMPASRILGGFYVLHQLGGGNVGTVFVAVRAERRHDPEAERFALKVPAFNATAARALSEQEFLRLFREEAGALLAIPEHLNLARLISFDAGAQPKPILVMELVEGPGCDRVVAARSLSAPRALAILDGILGGLEAMHAVGIAHLDLKPSNVILREAEEPVLVDFGLAGRKLRPGCGTLCYGAPEVWNAADQTASPAPAADVYAFGCAAFELLTATTLFDGPNDVAIIAAHVSHDGLPRPVETMARHGPLQALAMCLFQCLRQDPRKRATVSQLRRELGRIAPELGKLAWPLRIA